MVENEIIFGKKNNHSPKIQARSQSAKKPNVITLRIAINDSTALVW